MASDKPMVLVDGGVENSNSAVDEVVESGLLNRVLVQTEVHFSKLLIESWWRVIKHQWLYLNTLDRVPTVRKLGRFLRRATQPASSAFGASRPNAG